MSGAVGLLVGEVDRGAASTKLALATKPLGRPDSICCPSTLYFAVKVSDRANLKELPVAGGRAGLHVSVITERRFCVTTET